MLDFAGSKSIIYRFLFTWLGLSLLLVSLVQGAEVGEIYRTENGKASYEILKRLGSGSFGIVWKAKEISTGEIFAIKFAKSESHLNEETLQTYRLIAYLEGEQKLKNTLKVYFPENVFLQISSGQSKSNPTQILRFELADQTLNDLRSTHFNMNGRFQSENVAFRVEETYRMIGDILTAFDDWKKERLHHFDPNERNIFRLPSGNYVLGDVDGARPHGIKYPPKAWELRIGPIEYEDPEYKFDDKNLGDIHQFANTVYFLMIGNFWLENLYHSEHQVLAKQMGRPISFAEYRTLLYQNPSMQMNADIKLLKDLTRLEFDLVSQSPENVRPELRAIFRFLKAGMLLHLPSRAQAFKDENFADLLKKIHLDERAVEVPPEPTGETTFPKRQPETPTRKAPSRIEDKWKLAHEGKPEPEPPSENKFITLIDQIYEKNLIGEKLRKELDPYIENTEFQKAVVRHRPEMVTRLFELPSPSSALADRLTDAVFDADWSKGYRQLFFSYSMDRWNDDNIQDTVVSNEDFQFLKNALDRDLESPKDFLKAYVALRSILSWSAFDKETSAPPMTLSPENAEALRKIMIRFAGRKISTEAKHAVVDQMGELTPAWLLEGVRIEFSKQVGRHLLSAYKFKEASPLDWDFVLDLYEKEKTKGEIVHSSDMAANLIGYYLKIESKKNQLSALDALRSSRFSTLALHSIVERKNYFFANAEFVKGLGPALATIDRKALDHLALKSYKYLKSRVSSHRKIYLPFKACGFVLAKLRIVRSNSTPQLIP